MDKTANSGAALLGQMLRGFGLGLLVFWTIISFGPLYGLAYSETETAITLAFLATSALTVWTVYLLALLVSSWEGRPLVNRLFLKSLPAIGVYSVAWITAYGFLG